MAFNSLLAGQSSLAVNSGVNLTLTPDTFAMFQAGGAGREVPGCLVPACAGQDAATGSRRILVTATLPLACLAQRAGMMGAEGRCKALDAAADGYVRSEACVSVLLHPLAGPNDSAASGWAVMLHGTAVNQGGRSSTLTAPNGPSQQAVIRAALDEAGLAPASITALSMHGTGEAALMCACITCYGMCPPSFACSALHSMACPPLTACPGPLQAPPWETPSRWGRSRRCWWRARMRRGRASRSCCTAPNPGWATQVRRGRTSQADWRRG